MANNNNPDFEIIALTEDSWIDEPEPLGGDPGFEIMGCGSGCGGCGSIATCCATGLADD